jgi:hypothetical protein
MAESSKHGTVWQDYELDVIISDYFAMPKQGTSSETIRQSPTQF